MALLCSIKRFILIGLLCLCIQNSFSKDFITSDTIKPSIERSYTARNFSELRTFNFQWEFSPHYNYQVRKGGKVYNEGTMQVVRDAKIQSTFPLFRKNSLSVYANLNMDYYHLQPMASSKEMNDDSQKLFSQENTNYFYYSGNVAINYRWRLLGKSLSVSGSLGADGWEHGIKKLQIGALANSVITHTDKDLFAVGLYAQYPYILIPVSPLLIWSHHFTPSLIFDATLPSRIYLRYQFGPHRISGGAQLSYKKFYIDAPASFKDEKSTDRTTYFYNTNSLNTEFVYECILNRHFYLIARTGSSFWLSGGLYDVARSGIKGKPFVDVSHRPIPYFHLGISYNLF